MHIPINFMHHYMAILITASIAIKGFMLWKNKNTINNLIALAAVPFCISFICFGVPAIFTQDAKTIQLGFVFGDVLQYLGLFLMWLAVVRIYTSANSLARKLLLTFIVTLALTTTYISIIENTRHYPVMYHTGKYWIVDYAYTNLHMSIAAVYYSSFALLGLYFMRQSKKIESSISKWRVRVYGIAFTGVSLVMIGGAVAGAGVDSAASILMFVISYFLIGIILLVNQVHKKINRKQTK